MHGRWEGTGWSNDYGESVWRRSLRGCAGGRSVVVASCHVSERLLGHYLSLFLLATQRLNGSTRRKNTYRYTTQSSLMTLHSTPVRR